MLLDMRLLIFEMLPVMENGDFIHTYSILCEVFRNINIENSAVFSADRYVCVSKAPLDQATGRLNYALCFPNSSYIRKKICFLKSVLTLGRIIRGLKQALYFRYGFVCFAAALIFQFYYIFVPLILKFWSKKYYFFLYFFTNKNFAPQAKPGGQNYLPGGAKLLKYIDFQNSGGGGKSPPPPDAHSFNPMILLPKVKTLLRKHFFPYF